MDETATRRRLSPDTTLARCPTAPRYVFQGRLPALEAACRAMGFEAVPPMLKAEGTVERGALRLGPFELLLLGHAPDAAALGEVAHSLVTVSDRNVTLRLEGPYATRILAGLCPLDFARAAFPVGMATRTLLDKADAVLWRTGEQTFHIEVWRSFVPYVEEALRLVGESVVFSALET